MHDGAAFLIDHVFPPVPVRMWVISFPPPLRYLLAYDADIFAEVLRIFLDEVFSYLKQTAKRELGLDELSDTHAHSGAVSFVQRFGDGLRSNCHVHSLVLDGVYVQTDRHEPPVFRALPPPTNVDIRAIGTNVWIRTTRLLQQRGRYFDADPSEADVLAQEHPLLAAAYAASIRNMIATGPRAGQGVLHLGASDAEGANIDAERATRNGEPTHGYSVHAGVRVPAWDRRQLERLCRYASRGPIATGRLSLTSDGHVVVRLRRPWRDGTTHLKLTAHELIEKLCALVAPPRFNLVRFHGLLAPNHRLRSLVVPRSDDGELTMPNKQLPLLGRRRRKRQRDGRLRQEPRPRMPWPQLMQRTWGVDVLACARCGGRMKLVAFATEPRAIQRLLAGLGEPYEVPDTRLARGPPTGQLELFGADDDARVAAA